MTWWGTDNHVFWYQHLPALLEPTVPHSVHQPVVTAKMSLLQKVRNQKYQHQLSGIRISTDRKDVTINLSGKQKTPKLYPLTDTNKQQNRILPFHLLCSSMDKSYNPWRTVPMAEFPAEIQKSRASTIFLSNSTLFVLTGLQ